MVVHRQREIEGLVRANQATARLLRDLADLVRPGITTAELDTSARAAIARLGAEPVFATEAGFPGAINTSVNDVCLHGVPGAYRLREGDILSIDAGMSLGGFVGDATITVAVGQITPAQRHLIEATRGAMEAGIAAARTGNRIGDIGHAIQRHAEARGFGVIRGFTGHGLGRRMHEPPMVPFVGEPGTGPRLMEGLVITIEPILTEGSPEWRVDEDGWTVRTLDGGHAAQFEHTVMVTPTGGRVLSNE
jgi:methionyl aminopeptidase